MSFMRAISHPLLLFLAVILMELEYSRVAPQPVEEYITVTYKPIVVKSFEEMMQHTNGVPGRIIVLNRKLLRGKPGQPKMIYRIILKNEDVNDNKQEDVNNEIADNEVDNNDCEIIDNENYGNEIVENDDSGDEDGHSLYKYDIDAQNEDKYEDVDPQDE